MTKVTDFSEIKVRGGFEFFTEQRMELDVDDNPLYVGYSKAPNAPTDEPVWFIIKNTWSGPNQKTRQQLPDEGCKFSYIWDNREGYFS